MVLWDPGKIISCLFLIIWYIIFIIHNNLILGYLFAFKSFFIQIGHKNRNDVKTKLTEEEALSIVKDLYVIATERDIYTGDSVEIKIIKKDGVKTELFSLKKD